MSDKPIDVLTPLAACALFGQSGESVRRAVREGHVETLFSLAFTGKELRLIDLQSAMAYWGTDPWPAYREPLYRELDRMRGYGVTVNFGVGDYQILHAYPVVGFGPNIELLPEGDGLSAD